MRRIIIDTDPGQDDAIAILLALGSPELEVLGLTAVAGNVGLANTEANTRRVCELAGRQDMLVFAGCARPLMGEVVDASQVHGKTGLDGCGLPAPTMPLQAQHAVEWLIHTLREAPPRSITLCTLGPFTNIATALVQDPSIAAAIEEIVAMGGAIHRGGNITPTAEFNVYADPHAADIVFKSGVPITLMPLDVTHKALVTEERLRRFHELPAPLGEACHGMLSFYFRPNEARFGEAGSPLHDPCVIAYLIAPEIFSGKTISVAIETNSPLTMGMTVGDWWGASERAHNATVMNDIDAGTFFDMILNRLSTLRSEAT
ncbi:MAG: nucleoside hydrolase [Gammaproteobacteria bacterium]|nr:nucleoside hydrolase [Gammaproteobacteria bacterium]